MQNQRLKNIAEPVNEGLMGVATGLQRIKELINLEAQKAIEEDNGQILSVYSNIMSIIINTFGEINKMQRVLSSELTSERKLLSSIAWDEEDDITDLI